MFGDKIDKELKERNIDGFLSFNNAHNDNQYYLTRFKCYDNFLFLRKPDSSIVLVPSLEENRAVKEADVDEVFSMKDYVDDDVRGNMDKEISIIINFLQDMNISNIMVSKNEKYHLVNELKNKGINVELINNSIINYRTIKKPYEVDNLREVQKVTQESMNYAKKILKKSNINGDKLLYEDKILTSKLLKQKIRKFLIERNCHIKDFILVSGSQGYDPHNYGSGELRPHEPILLDIFPRHNNMYWGDMTRTFVKGNISEEVKNMHNATLEAFDGIFDVIKNGAGISCKDIHYKVCDIYNDWGYDTIREGSVEEGLLHSTGHGIGVSLHEKPRISGNEDTISPNTVLTIEPGLYNKKIGAVRFEDMILIKEDGYENFNNYEYSLEL